MSRAKGPPSSSPTAALFFEKKRATLSESLAGQRALLRRTFTHQNAVDLLLEQYNCTPQSLLLTWETLTFSTSAFADQAVPTTEEAVAAIEKALKASTRPRATAGIRAPLDSTSALNITPLATKKPRASEGISPPPKQARVADKTKAPVHNDTLGAVQPDPAGPMTDVALLSPKLPSPLRYMHARLDTVADCARQALAEFGQRILGDCSPPKSSEDAAARFDPVGAPVHGRNVLVLGRVVCDGESGSKLTAKSAMLEGTNGVRVLMDLGLFSERFSLFPGQHLVVEGSCTSGVLIQVERIYEGKPQAAPTRALVEAKKIWVASGPFTNVQDLSYAPLTALLQECARQAPDVLVLIGPIVDCEHPMIKRGDARVLDITVTFQTVFDVCLAKINTELNSVRTRVVIVASSDEVVNSHPALPQPPTPLPMTKDVDTKRFVSMPNPCVFQVGGEGGPVIGVGNVDVLFHFMDEGSPQQGCTEGLARLSNHLLAQQSFYPLVPPHPEACVDSTLRRHFEMPLLDVLVCPSKLKSFVHKVGEVLCINPGKSLPNKSSAGFVTMDMHPGEGLVADKTRVELLSVDF